MESPSLADSSAVFCWTPRPQRPLSCWPRLPLPTSDLAMPRRPASCEPSSQTKVREMLPTEEPPRPHESERFKSFTYEELLKRDKVNLDIFWLKDESLEESANLPAPEVIAQEITDDLEAALEQFATIAEDLTK